MGRKIQRACEACTHNCLFFHETKTTTPTSFFKVIVKDENLRVLYIPPNFSRTVSDLVNKEIILKDSSGQKWKVKISKVDGSLAFEEGWNVFSSDHGLKVGYFLVFNYIKHSDFDVKIYDTSACERLDSLKNRNQKKRSRCRSGSPVKDGTMVTQGLNALVITKPDVPTKKCKRRSGSPVRDGTLVTQCPSALVVSKPDVPKKKRLRRDVDLVETQNSIESAQPMCISEHCEDPCYLTSLEFEDKERDDQSCGVIGMTMKIANGDSEVSNVDYGSHQNDAMVCNEDPVFGGILGTGAASDAPELEMSGRSNSLGETDKNTYGKSLTPKLEENIENNAIISNREARECLGEMKKVTADMTPKPCCSVDKLHATGKMSIETKKELVTLDELEATGLPGEIIQDNESHFKNAATLSCVVPNENNEITQMLAFDQSTAKKTAEDGGVTSGFSEEIVDGGLPRTTEFTITDTWMVRFLQS